MPTPPPHPEQALAEYSLPPMSSLSPECNELKKQYDDCFNGWFSKFLEGDQNLSVCDKYLNDYTACVKAAMVRMNIDVKEVEKEMLKEKSSSSTKS